MRWREIGSGAAGHRIAGTAADEDHACKQRPDRGCTLLHAASLRAKRGTRVAERVPTMDA